MCHLGEWTNIYMYGQGGRLGCSWSRSAGENSVSNRTGERSLAGNQEKMLSNLVMTSDPLGGH